MHRTTSVIKKPVFLYSKYCRHSVDALSHTDTETFDYLCVDNPDIRHRVLHDTTFSIRHVPCIIFADGTCIQGHDVIEWIHQNTEAEHLDTEPIHIPPQHPPTTIKNDTPTGAHPSHQDQRMDTTEDERVKEPKRPDIMSLAQRLQKERDQETMVTTGMSTLGERGL
jgi:hypothetical protein